MPLLASLGGDTLRSGEGSSGKLHLGYCYRALFLQLTGDLLLDKDVLQYVGQYGQVSMWVLSSIPGSISGSFPFAEFSSSCPKCHYMKVVLLRSAPLNSLGTIAVLHSPSPLSKLFSLHEGSRGHQTP